MRRDNPGFNYKPRPTSFPGQLWPAGGHIAERGWEAKSLVNVCKRGVNYEFDISQGLETPVLTLRAVAGAGTRGYKYQMLRVLRWSGFKNSRYCWSLEMVWVLNIRYCWNLEMVWVACTDH